MRRFWCGFHFRLFQARLWRTRLGNAHHCRWRQVVGQGPNVPELRSGCVTSQALGNGSLTPSRKAAKKINVRCCFFCNERNGLPFFAALRLGVRMAVVGSSADVPPIASCTPRESCEKTLPKPSAHGPRTCLKGAARRRPACRPPRGAAASRSASTTARPPASQRTRREPAFGRFPIE
jgi:hypothetical protein